MSLKYFQQNIAGKDAKEGVPGCPTPYPLILSALKRAIAAIVVVVALLSWGVLPAAADDSPLAFTGESTGSAAEWHNAKRILLHTPGEELFFGMVHPEAALFDEAFSITEAATEHENYITQLKTAVSDDDNVITVSEALIGQHANKERLLKLVKEVTSLKMNLCYADTESQVEYFDKKLNDLYDNTKDILVQMALQQPTITLNYAEGKGCGDGQAGQYGVVADYEANPLMNMYFTRDQMITTANGVVLGKMAKEPRRPETEIMNLVLQNLQITPIHTISGEKATLEGGDFIPAGQFVFIGEGDRTNEEAINELLANFNLVFGSDVKKVVVVQDPWKDQSQMHLDTYFNIAGSEVAVLSKDRLGENCQNSDVNKCLKVKICTNNNSSLDDCNAYEDGNNDAFKTFLKDSTNGPGFKYVISVPKEDQEKYGVNFLTVADKKIFINGYYDPQSPTKYIKDLTTAGVEVTQVNLNELSKGYGAAHCMTQVLKREE